MVVLVPMQFGSDLSEFPDTFWHLVKLEGVNEDFSGVVIHLGEGTVTFSTPACLRSYPFGLRLAGLEFFPAYEWAYDEHHMRRSKDKEISSAFEHALHEIGSYKAAEGSLTFNSKSGKPLIVMSRIRPEGIENRRWNIARVRGNGAQMVDKDGLVETKVPAEILFLNGRVSGSPGCGGWVGMYELKNGFLTVHASWALAGLCSGEAFAQNDLVVPAFNETLRVEVKGDQITLRDKDGNEEVLLVPF